jgi:beta-lactamase class A
LGLLLVGVTALVEPRVLLSAGEPLRGLTFTRPPVTSFVPPEARPDLDLQARVASATTVAAGSVGAVVIDLDTGRTASVQPRRPFPAASLFKLPILAEALRQGLDPNARLEVRPEDWADGSGVLQARVGERLAVRELLRLMVQESDNIAALVLLDALGVEAVNSTMERLGLGGTRLRDHRQGEPGEHVTTPADMARLLELIVSGRLASPTTSEQALALLELRQANAWLAEDLPWWVKIAHKWGDVPGARNDAGLVFSPRGSFVSVVLTEGVPPDQARRAIARTAAAAYDVLGS